MRTGHRVGFFYSPSFEGRGCPSLKGGGDRRFHRSPTFAGALTGPARLLSPPYSQARRHSGHRPPGMGPRHTEQAASLP